MVDMDYNYNSHRVHIMENMENKKQKIAFLLIPLFAFCFLLSSSFASAANLYFSPSSGSYTAGQTFSVGVFVSSADKAMNAASGAISFTSDKLEVASLSKAGSIFTLWVQEPSFLNPPAGGQGLVNFEGIALNPGFTGIGGKLITVNFRAKTSGIASLNFSSGSVLANDGKGTNILTSLGNANFALEETAGFSVPQTATPPTPSKTPGAPSAPQISSPTHPDYNKWYNDNTAKFNWILPPEITSVRLLIDKKPDSVPVKTYTPAISEKEIPDLEDGIWYFHARFKNKIGWGDISHYRVQIDTAPPESFQIKFIGSEAEEENAALTIVSDPQPKIFISASDSLSGIDYYKAKVGGGDFFDIPLNALKDNIYILPRQIPGQRNILVQAFDRAGNYVSDTEEFAVLHSEAPIVNISTSSFSDIFTKITSTFILATIFVAVLVFLLVLIILFRSLWRKLKNLKKKLSKETKEVDEGVSRVFELLRQDLKEYIKILREAKTKRELTKEEEKILRALMKNFDDSEKFLKKEVEDIKKIL